MFKPIITLAFWLVFMGTGILMQAAMVACTLLVSDPHTKQRIFQKARLLWSAINLRWFFKTPLLHELQKSSSQLPEQFILVSNHRCNLDPLFVFVAGRPLVFLSKKSVLKTPVVGWWMRLCGDVPVERGDKSSREKSLNAMKECLRKGDSLLIFPEGTRQTDPTVELGPFKDGAFNIASETGTPIVLLILKDTHTVWKKGSLFLDLNPLRYALSQPIQSRGRDSESLKREAIEKMTEMIQSLRV